MNTNPNVTVVELRNYLLKPGTREQFINYFEDHFLDSQHGAHILPPFRIQGETDRFFWIRGFEDMQSRLAFLRGFYEQGEVWKRFGPGANEMMLDSDHVHFLKPLSASFEWNELAKEAGVVVIDFYLAKASQLDQLIDSFERDYLSCLKNKPTLLISEMASNDFPRLPVIQDPNLLVVINRYADESEYQLQSQLCLESRNRMREFVADESKLILHPTVRLSAENARAVSET
jgi:hypothetical protein